MFSDVSAGRTSFPTDGIPTATTTSPERAVPILSCPFLQIPMTVTPMPVCSTSMFFSVLPVTARLGSKPAFSASALIPLRIAAPDGLSATLKASTMQKGMALTARTSIRAVLAVNFPKVKPSTFILSSGLGPIPPAESQPTTRTSSCANSKRRTSLLVLI